jgi:hypothetical protein
MAAKMNLQPLQPERKHPKKNPQQSLPAAGVAIGKKRFFLLSFCRSIEFNTLICIKI